MKLSSCVVIVSLFTSLFSFAQEVVKPRVSPLAIASAHYKNTYLKITYGQPQKNGRVIFGGLVPYAKVWRTGANEATEITITNDIKINNTLLKAGTYSMFTIPEKEKWTVILNSDLGQWGDYNYNSKMDVLRFEVPSLVIPDNVVYESFTIRVNQKTDTAEISLLWEHTQVNIPVQFIEPKP
jgi:hypothetical protein